MTSKIMSIIKFGLALLLLSPAHLVVAETLADPMQPFFSISGAGNKLPTQVQANKIKRPPKLILSSVTIIGDHKSILVNGQYLEIGQSIKNARLVDIMTNQAVFEFQKKKIVVHMPTSGAIITPVRIENEETE